MPAFDYVYDDEQVIGLHRRALDVYRAIVASEDVPLQIRPNLYNSVLNMCAQIRAPQLAQYGIQLPQGEIR